MRQTHTNRPIGVMNKDADPRDLREIDYVDALNIVGGYGTGVNGARIPYKSFRQPLAPVVLHAGAKCIGWAADNTHGTIIYFVYSPDSNHTIWRYYPEDEFSVLLCYGSFLNFSPNWHVQAKVIDGKILYWTDGTTNGNEIDGNPPRMLNIQKADNTGKLFQYELLADGAFADGTVYRIDFYDQNYNPTGDFDELTLAGVAGDKEAAMEAIAAWLDNLPPSAFYSVTASTDGKSVIFTVDSQEVRARITSTADFRYTVPVNHYIFEDIFPVPVYENVMADQDLEFMISREKYQPQFAPTIEYDNDPAFDGNFLRGLMPQFTWRYVFDNGEKTKWAQYSKLIVPDDDDNRIAVTFDDRWLNAGATLGLIKNIEFAVRNSNEDVFRLIKTISRGDLQIGSDYSFYFYNDAQYPVVASDEDGAADQQVLGLFDYMPDISGTLEAISDEEGNTRLIDGAVKLGFDPVRTDVDVSTVATVGNDGIYKKNSRYQFGIIYARRGGKRSAVNPINVYTTPDWVTDGYNPKNIRLTINHLPPDDATHYYIVRKKNLSYARWKPLFANGDIFSITDNVVQYGSLLNNEDGFVNNGFGDPANTHVRFRIVVPQLNQDPTDDIVSIFANDDPKWFFVPSEGDRFRVILNADASSVSPPTGLDDDYEIDAYEFETLTLGTTPTSSFYVMWLYAKIDGSTPNYMDAGTYPLDSFVVELYTPRRADDGLYYEILGGEIAGGFHKGTFQDQTALLPAIVDLHGTGDAYFRDKMHPDTPYVGVFTQDQYEVENAFLFYDSKDEGIGKPNAEDPNQASMLYRSRMYVSDIYIQGSQINGLSSIRANSFKQVNNTFGSIKKLQMSGEVLLAICEFKVQPIYVGANRMIDLSGNTSVGRSTNLLNIAKELEEMAGTKHPMSVIDFDGATYFWDAFNGRWWRYNKGLYAISDYGMTKHFKDKSMETGYDLPDQNWAVCGYDPIHKMPLLTVEWVREALTYGFAEGEPAETKGFRGMFSFAPEMYAMLGQRLFSFKLGKIWIHNEGNTYCNFYGVQYTPTITLSANPAPSEIKHFWNIRVTCPQQKLVLPNNDSILIPPSDMYFSGMASRLKAGKFVNYESKWFADFMRDMNDTSEPFASITPTATRQLQALVYGRHLRGEYILLKFQPESNNEYFALYHVDTEWSKSFK